MTEFYKGSDEFFFFLYMMLKLQITLKSEILTLKTGISEGTKNNDSRLSEAKSTTLFY